MNNHSLISASGNTHAKIAVLGFGVFPRLCRGDRGFRRYADRKHGAQLRPDREGDDHYHGRWRRDRSLKRMARLKPNPSNRAAPRVVHPDMLSRSRRS